MAHDSDVNAADARTGPTARDATGAQDGFLQNLVALRHRLRPGARIRVIQQIAARHYAWGTAHEGTVVKYAQKQTGSWFAHSRGDKLWLDRLVLRKDDGEIFTFNLDEYTHIDILADAPEAGSEELAGQVSPAEMPGA